LNAVQLFCHDPSFSIEPTKPLSRYYTVLFSNKPGTIGHCRRGIHGQRLRIFKLEPAFAHTK